MKLSEAIVEPGLPQGFGVESFWSDTKPCALGCARIAAKLVRDVYDDRDSYDFMREAFPVLRMQLPHVCVADKECHMIASDYDHGTTVLRMVYHLNDHHKWTLSQIAKWVNSVEV